MLIARVRSGLVRANSDCSVVRWFASLLSLVCIVAVEPTANIDTHTDTTIQRLVRQEFSQSTIITIAHRLNTIIDYDRVCFMEMGEMREFGVPAELLADPDGHLSRLVDALGEEAAKGLRVKAGCSAAWL